MGKRQKSQKPDASGSTSPLAHNPFAGLGGASTSDPPAPPAEPRPAASPAAEPAKTELSGKWVVRRERKGHGGKTVTIAKGPAPAQGWDALAKTMGRAMGCRASAGDAELVLSGDQRERVASWLRERGAREVVLGN